MRVMVGVSVIILFSLWVVPVAGFLPGDITVTSNPEWAIAGGGPVIIIVKVHNTTLGNPAYDHGVRDVTVAIQVQNPTIGHISPAESSTNNLGDARFTFTPKSIKGDAIISVSVSHNASAQLENPILYVQKIDHAEPKKWALLSYDSPVTVNQTTSIVARFTDAYSNALDDRRFTETVVFSDSIDNDGGFCTPTSCVNSFPVTIGSDGNATARYKMASSAGPNVIMVKAPVPIIPLNHYITIQGTGDGNNITAITADVQPLSPLRANSKDYYSILYTLTDIYGNPVPHTPFWRNSSLGEHERFMTNDDGQAMTTYGPKKSIGTITVDASAETAPDVHISTVLTFIHSDPEIWELTASPQTLASRDVKNDISADIRAKVMDALGFPVVNTTVSFRIIGYTNNTLLITPPSFNPKEEVRMITAITDEDGFAIVPLYPGSFPLIGEEGYSPGAAGSVTVEANWEERIKDIGLTFVNYPYLRVETRVDPQTVAINDTINLSIRLIGDGWAFQRPIDVVLCTDRSGSMLINDTDKIVDDRMVHAMNAAKSFNSLLSGKDRIGLVTFGDNSDTDGWAKLSGSHGNRYLYYYWAGSDYVGDEDSYIIQHYPANPRRYSGFATDDQQLTFSHHAMISSINRIVPAGGTPLREGLYRSINMILNNPITKRTAVNAIILLTDGEWNTGGDPRGGPLAIALPGIEQGSVITRAKENGIRIYTIGLGIEPYHDQLEAYAEETGGKYYYAATADELGSIYQEIAGDLSSLAGVDTVMSLHFEQVDVTYDNVTTPTPGKDVFEYRYIDGISTTIESWNLTHSLIPRSSIDQTADWSRDPPQLNFIVGNITINQIWETNLTFQVRKEGNINIFGKGSQVAFAREEGSEVTCPTEGCILTMPATYITVTNMTAGSLNPATIDVKGLYSPNYQGPESPIDILLLEWTLNYTGQRLVIQDVYYQFSRDNVVWAFGDWSTCNSWPHMATLNPSPGPIIDENFTAPVDVRRVSGFYKFCVKAREDVPGGISDDDRILEPIQIGNTMSYIEIH